jgi:hypothetical protein
LRDQIGKLNIAVSAGGRPALVTANLGRRHG